jgi:hypothetical protein
MTLIIRPKVIYMKKIVKGQNHRKKQHKKFQNKNNEC